MRAQPVEHIVANVLIVHNVDNRWKIQEKVFSFNYLCYVKLCSYLSLFYSDELSAYNAFVRL